MALDTPPPKTPDRANGKARPTPTRVDTPRPVPSSGGDGRRVPASPRLLDPHGIYGTRTANRMHIARRRRMVQNGVLLLLLFGAGLGIWMWQRLPRMPVLQSSWSRNLVSMPSAPAVAASDGNKNFLLLPTDSGRLVVMNIRDGSSRDIVVTDFPLRARPLVVGSLAFVPAEDGTLSALNWKTGRVLWRHRSPMAISARPTSAYLTLPSVMVAPSPAMTPPPIPVPTPSGASATPTAQAVVAEPTPAAPQRQLVVFSGNDDGLVEAIRSGNGKVLWKRQLAAPVGNGLQIVDSTNSMGRNVPLLLVPVMGGVVSRGGLRCLNATNGREMWHYPADPKVFATQLPAPTWADVDGHMLVFCADDTGLVSAVDAQNGQKKWKTFIPALPEATANAAVVLRCEPLVARFDGHWRLFVAGNDGGVRCLDAKDGRLLWTFEAGDAVRGSLQIFDSQPSATAAQASVPTSGTEMALPELANPVLVVGTDGATNYLLDGRTGQPVSRTATTGGAVQGALVMGGQLICVGRGGAVESFSLAALSR